MKKIIFTGLVLSLALPSCTSRSKQYEQNALDCWGKVWLPSSDPSGKTFEQGMTALDNYLMSKGYLGKGTPADYIKFANDTQQVVIPENIPDFKIIQLALKSDNAGAPDANACANCIIHNVIDHIHDLDSTDALYRFGKMFDALGKAGAPDNSMILKFYSTLTQDEFQRPLLKAIFYFSISNMKGGKNYPKLSVSDK